LPVLQGEGGVIRKEVIGDATLYLGDCLEIMPHLETVDHVISDPPYEDELHKAMGRIRRNDGQEMIQTLGFEGVNGTRDKIAEHCVKLSSGWLILFTLAEGVRAWRDDIQAAGAKWDTTLAWIKPDSSPRFNGQGAARGFECAVTAWCGSGYRSWNGGGKRGVFTHCVNVGREGQHPTEKPLPLMLELVDLYTNHGQTILDPFLGSGTTGVAAIKRGRRFIGIERDLRWFDLACDRISAAAKQPDMFIHVAPKAMQETML
jgi:site-specific DNA-methyltransferase (adenine-specific)